MVPKGTHPNGEQRPHGHAIKPDRLLALQPGCSEGRHRTRETKTTKQRTAVATTTAAVDPLILHSGSPPSATAPAPIVIVDGFLITIANLPEIKGFCFICAFSMFTNGHDSKG